jgi:hypothetical protein
MGPPRQPYPDRVQYHVLWQNLHLPVHNSWMLSLSGAQPLILMGLFSAFLSYAAERAWVIEQWVTKRCKKYRGSELSQSQAIKLLLRTAGSTSEPKPQVPKIFGVVALLNIAIFLVLGIYVPWALGYDEKYASVVLAKNNINCPQDIDWPSLTHTITSTFATLCNDANRNPWENHMPCKQFPLASTQLPKFTFWNTPCPFDDSACLEGVKPFLIKHSNINIKDLGINSKSRATMDHYLNCAPLNLTKFHYPMKNSDEHLAPQSFVSFRKDPIGGRYQDELEHPLLHRNLRRTADDVLHFIPGKAQVRIFPDRKDTIADHLVSNTSYLELLHPDLQRDDGLVYVIGFQQGLTTFTADQTIEDPIFKADLRLPHTDMYFPTFHFTAIGCLEQFRYCFTDETGEDMCGPFSAMPWDHTNATSMRDWLYNHGLEDEAKDFSSIWVRFARRASMSYYIARAATMTDYDRHLVVNIRDEWSSQLKSWFLAAHFHARFSVVLNVLPNKGMGVRKGEDDLENICHRILLRDGNYTNVNFLGLVFTVVGLMVVCLLSYDFVSGPLVRFCDPILPNWMRETKID